MRIPVSSFKESIYTNFGDIVINTVSDSGVGTATIHQGSTKVWFDERGYTVDYDTLDDFLDSLKNHNTEIRTIQLYDEDGYHDLTLDQLRTILSER